VQRNRARRRLRAAVEQVMPAHAAPGHDYVVIARAGTLTRDFPALIGDLENALKRLGTYRDGGAPARPGA
jgi:ribonuclease P protein component